MHAEIYMENWKDLVYFAQMSKLQIFSETITPGVSHRLWSVVFPDSSSSVVTILMATISAEQLGALNEVGDIPNRKVVPASIEVIHE